MAVPEDLAGDWIRVRTDDGYVPDLATIVVAVREALRGGWAREARTAPLGPRGSR